MLSTSVNCTVLKLLPNYFEPECPLMRLNVFCSPTKLLREGIGKCSPANINSADTNLRSLVYSEFNLKLGVVGILAYGHLNSTKSLKVAVYWNYIVYEESWSIEVQLLSWVGLLKQWIVVYVGGFISCFTCIDSKLLIFQ